MVICGGFDLSCRHFSLSFIRIRPSNMQLDFLAFWIFERVGKSGGFMLRRLTCQRVPPPLLFISGPAAVDANHVDGWRPADSFPPLSHLTGCNYEVRESLRSYIVNPAGLSFPRPLLLHGNIHVTHKGGKPPSPPTPPWQIRWLDSSCYRPKCVWGAYIRLWPCLGLERSSNRRLVDRYLSWSHISS